ncbi:hypothetical protein F4859DRAFT_464788 [Xylaria cf. heliscus]|nr:hypothetical protein F4859DRAFT_464788 [Xylaria cf. heliscus]
MSSMSRNNSTNSLMGFSVHQPTIGAPLQFFPAMGSKQLDEMINAYIPGDVSILDKRAAVSMEFFEYSMATGDLFKFFMVYPTLGSANTSPTTDSGYHSGFTTSPVMSETQWASSSSHMVSPSSSRKATSANDFSNLPGMKIMTKDGRDVTNSASRGCKTKEQRDHAHLMRIIKACDSCRRKKTKCDPSHKRPAAGTSSGKITKKTSKNPRPAAAPPQIAAKQASATIEFDQMLSESSSSLDSFFSESLNLPTDGFSMEWDQFIQFDEEPSEVIPYDYNFLLDPAGYFSPATTASFSSSSTSPSQLPITPIDRDIHITDDTTVGHDHKPILPYLNPGGLEAGDNYVDFNLYSPESSWLDEELGLVKEVAASPIQSQPLDRHRRRRVGTTEEAVRDAAGLQFANNVLHSESIDSCRQDVVFDVGDGLLHDTSNYMHERSEGSVLGQTASQVVFNGHPRANPSSVGQATISHTAINATPAGLSVVGNVLEDVTSEGLYGREAIYGHASSRPLFDRGRRRAQSSFVQTSAADAVAGLQERQVLLQGSLDYHSLDAGAQSSSSQLGPDRSCGQDGLNRTERTMTSTRTTTVLVTKTTDGQSMGTQGGSFVSNDRLSTIRPELNVSQDNVQNEQSTKMSHGDMYRVPCGDASSPLPSLTPSPTPVVMKPSSLYATSSPNHTSSSENCGADKQVIERPASVHRQRNVYQVAPWSSRSEPLQSTSAMQKLATLGSQSVSSDTMQMASVIASLGVMPLASLRAKTTMGNDLAQDVQSVAGGNLSACIIAMLLFSLSLSTPSSYIYVLLISALSIVGGYLQLQRNMPSHDAKIQSSESPASHNLAFTKQLLYSKRNLKAAYAKATGLVQCNLAKRFGSRAHPVRSIAGCNAIYAGKLG